MLFIRLCVVQRINISSLAENKDLATLRRNKMEDSIPQPLITTLITFYVTYIYGKNYRSIELHATVWGTAKKQSNINIMSQQMHLYIIKY
jgi:hypothetical protein